MTASSPTEVLREFQRRLDLRLNNHLCEMKPDFDDSITGFNEAWEIVSGLIKEILASPSEWAPVAGQEAVAWIVRGHGAPFSTLQQAEADYWSVRPKITIEPLYSAPPASAVAQIVAWLRAEAEQRLAERSNRVPLASTANRDPKARQDERNKALEQLAVWYRDAANAIERGEWQGIPVPKETK